MNVEWVSDADLHRKIDARRSMKGQRARLRCKRCKKSIPENKRIDSIYCSKKCQKVYRWEQITALRTEMRGVYRIIMAPTMCKCGEPLDNHPGKHAPFKRICRRCSNRETQQRKRRKREREKVQS